MKLFSGGGNRRDNQPRPQKQTANRLPAKRRRKKKIIIVVLVILALVLCVAAACKVFVRPPSLAKHIVNDGSSQVEVDEDGEPVDLNMGTRISDFFTFVVCATDIDETRTDNIMVVAFDTKAHTVNVMNIPRDLMSNVSRTGASRKINAAYGTSKGIQQTKAEIKKVMGFTPDKYMVVNFNGIAEIVDAIGGVDYDIPFPMMYSDPAQDLEINFPVAGMQHLDGEQVVEFLRWRKNGSGYTQYVPAEYKNGDETRIAKQQEFLMYLAKQVLTIKNIPNIPSIADAVFRNVETDITAGEMLWLAGQAWQVDTKTGIQMFTLPGYSAMSTAGTNTEYSFYFAYEQQTLDLVNQYFNPYDQPITDLDLVSGPTKSTGSSSKDDEDDDSDYEDEEEPVIEDPEGPDSDTDPEGNGPPEEGGDTSSGGNTSGGGDTSSGGNTSGGGDTSSGGGNTSGGGDTSSGGGTSGGGDTSSGGGQPTNPTDPEA